jgi:hypothetical protein
VNVSDRHATCGSETDNCDFWQALQTEQGFSFSESGEEDFSKFGGQVVQATQQSVPILGWSARYYPMIP